MSEKAGDRLACQRIITTMARFSAFGALVRWQDDIDVFRATQMIQDKAQSAENGTVLFKGWY